jgi:hypothetical protein
MPRTSLSINIFVIAGLILAPVLAWSQQLPAGVQSPVRFAGNVTLLANGKKQSVPVSERTWAIPPGATIEDLRLGADGNLVVEVQSGVPTTIIDGKRQTRHLGEFFVVSAGQKVGVATTADRSAILHTLLLPVH